LASLGTVETRFNHRRCWPAGITSARPRGSLPRIPHPHDVAVADTPSPVGPELSRTPRTSCRLCAIVHASASQGMSGRNPARLDALLKRTATGRSFNASTMRQKDAGNILRDISTSQNAVPAFFPCSVRARTAVPRAAASTSCSTPGFAKPGKRIARSLHMAFSK